MYQEQRGHGEKVNWLVIAKECIPSFEKVRSEYRRRVELGKLRNSVYARLGRKGLEV
jgi:hypothetical protein